MNESFPTTIWEDIWSARNGNTRNMNQMLDRYRGPILSFLRWKGYREEEAEDLCQEVLLRVAKPEFLQKVDSTKGKFRVLLQVVTRHVVSEEVRRRKAAKREAPGKLLSLDEFRSGKDSPARREDSIFDQMWVGEILEQALRDLYADSVSRKTQHAEAFRLKFIEGKTQEEVAKRLNSTVANAKNFIHYARMKYKQLVLSAIRATCSSAEDFEEEVERLSPYLKARDV